MSTHQTTTERGDVYQRITDRIIASLEAGIRPWMKPWTTTEGAKITVTGGGGWIMPRRVTGEKYRGINVLILWSVAQEKGYRNTTWMTFKQAIELKGCVRKGEKGTEIVFANKTLIIDKNEKGEDETRMIPFMKGYTVFNVDQIDGLPGRFYRADEPAPVVTPVVVAPPAGPAAMPGVDAWVARLGADLRHGGDRAYYAPGRGRDWVQMPYLAQFKSTDGYYSTLLHELTHWTKDESRCNREWLAKRWGDAGYAAEELVAELGAAFMCADLDVVAETRPDHADYIGDWIKVLNNDKRAIFTASSKAQEACDWLHAKADAEGALEPLERIAAE